MKVKPPPFTATVDALGKASGFALASAILSLRWSRLACGVAAVAVGVFSIKLVINLSAPYNRAVISPKFTNKKESTVARVLAVMVMLVVSSYFPLLGIALGFGIGITIGLQIGRVQYLHMQGVTR